MVSVNLEQSNLATELEGVLPPGATFELSQEFYFEAAHTLERDYETESSRRIHGHTYSACITIKGVPYPNSGMIVDLASLREEVARIRELLDHRLLDEVETLGPATLENLCAYVYRQFKAREIIKKISVWREKSGDRCSLNLEI